MLKKLGFGFMRLPLLNKDDQTSFDISSQFVYYINIASTHGKAGDCIGCQKCEAACPQHIEIPRYLKDVSAAFDNMTLPVK